MNNWALISIQSLAVCHDEKAHLCLYTTAYKDGVHEVTLSQSSDEKSANMLIAELGYAVPILGSTLEMEFLTDQAGQYALRKHANSNMLKTLQPKKENFHLKNSDIFHISAQNID